jgi:hypothetical protein
MPDMIGYSSRPLKDITDGVCNSGRVCMTISDMTYIGGGYWGSAHAGETVKGEVRERCIQVYVASSVDSPLP